MAIAPKCDKCGKELRAYGAILFGPPNARSQTKKYHLCVACYKDIVKLLKVSN